MKRAAVVAAVLLALAPLGLAARSLAQVGPLPPITLLPTTTEAPAPTTPTTEDVTTTAPPVTEVPAVDTVVPIDTIPAPVDLLPLPADTTTASSTVSTSPPATRAATVALASGLRPASVTGAFGLGLGGVLLVALLLVVFTTIARQQLLSGGSSMTARRRARLIAGIACLALAAIVGLIGYLKLSLEPDVNRQIPYLASAGMAVVLLAAAGGAFIVGEQMRTDEQRLEELEAAVQQLAGIVAPTVEAAPRTRKATSRKG